MHVAPGLAGFGVADMAVDDGGTGLSRIDGRIGDLLIRGPTHGAIIHRQIADRIGPGRLVELEHAGIHGRAAGVSVGGGAVIREGSRAHLDDGAVAIDRSRSRQRSAQHRNRQSLFS